MSNAQQLVAACAAMAVLVLLVGLRLIQNRVSEMKAKQIHPQATSNSIQITSQLENVQAADNYKNLFEAPILFYALCAVALATNHTPNWLVWGVWAFVVLRYLHSFIQCTYNKVIHRLPVFLTSFFLITALWIIFAIGFIQISQK